MAIDVGRSCQWTDIELYYMFVDYSECKEKVSVGLNPRNNLICTLKKSFWLLCWEWVRGARVEAEGLEGPSNNLDERRWPRWEVQRWWEVKCIRIAAEWGWRRVRAVLWETQTTVSNSQVYKSAVSGETLSLTTFVWRSKTYHCTENHEVNEVINLIWRFEEKIWRKEWVLGHIHGQCEVLQKWSQHRSWEVSAAKEGA